MNQVQDPLYASQDSGFIIHVVYKKRWLVLFAFCLANITNAIAWLTYSPVAIKAAQKYDVSTTYINWLSLSYMAMYIPCAPIASYTLEKYGLRASVLCACALQLVGAAIRIAGVNSSTFYAVAIGQALCAVAQPFIISAPPKLSCVWFAEEQRALATGIATVSNAVGAGVGFLIPPMVLGPDEDIANFFWLHIVETGIMGFTFLFCLVFMAGTPPTPSSPTSITGVEHFTFSHYKEDVIRILSDRNYLLLFFSFSIGNGAFNVLGTLINQFIKPMHYSDSDTGNIGALFIVLGVVGAGIGSAIADYSHHHKLVLGLSFMASSGAMVWWKYALTPNNLTMLMACTGVIGFVMTPTMPINIELAASYVYPVGESTATGVLLSGGQIAGIIGVLVFGPWVNEGTEKGIDNTVWVMVGSAALAGIAALLFSGGLTRKEAEKATPKLQISSFPE